VFFDEMPPDQALPGRIYLLLFDDVVSTSFNPLEHYRRNPDGLSSLGGG